MGRGRSISPEHLELLSMVFLNHIYNGRCEHMSKQFCFESMLHFHRLKILFRLSPSLSPRSSQLLCMGIHRESSLYGIHGLRYVFLDYNHHHPSCLLMKPFVLNFFVGDELIPITHYNKLLLEEVPTSL